DFIKPKEQADCSTGYEYGSRQTNADDWRLLRTQEFRMMEFRIRLEICNIVAVRAEGNAAGHNGNQIRCYNCRGVGHFARDCTVRPRRRDDAYLQKQLLIAQKEEAGIQLQAEDGVEQDGETVEQHSANFKETRALYESLYQNLAVEVEKVN
nr:hypothetical protein [Tanacetum cinerariifolium]